MQLSIIIVNYNVKHFLEQCLCSVKIAMQGIEAEVIVVDNNSTDDSIVYLQPMFPWVRFILNKNNTGFAKANNQAVGVAGGEYILFLNPDTLLPEDCLHNCLQFMENNLQAGALGVRMMDGGGRFLPESKRAFPSPFTSLFKLVGLAALMPASKIFGRYHLGHLTATENNEVDVLAGAFMLVRTKVIDQVGSFDETFFMYGEDVDLSYRIQKAGWKNYYFAGAGIIHFKGESTKKGSLNYVRMFYQAMSLFVQKHYSSGRAGFFKIFISIAIWLRAGVSAFSRFLKWMGLPLADIFITLASLGAIAWLWEHVVKPGIQYKPEVMIVILPLFTFTFILAGGVAGLYDKWYRPGRALIAMMLAVIFNLAIYSLFNIDYRFSRGVILFGGILASVAIFIFRKLLLKTELLAAPGEDREIRQTLIVGSASSYKKIAQLMQLAGRNERVLGRVGLQDKEPHTAGSFNQLSNLLNALPAREIVFCIDGNFTLANAMAFMQSEKRKLRYKFFYEGSHSLVGSDSKETTGEALSSTESFAIDKQENRRMKKISDIFWCVFLLVFFPVHLLFVKKPAGLIRNIFQVFPGKKTWIGYCVFPAGLPPLPKAVIGSNGLPITASKTLNEESLSLIDYWYAKDYEWLNDSRLILRAYKHLGH